jgi:hypothetical protein
MLKGGAEKIKKHVFFKGFDWDALYHRRLTAPYPKAIKDKYDLTHFAL